MKHWEKGHIMMRCGNFYSNLCSTVIRTFAHFGNPKTAGPHFFTHPTLHLSRHSGGGAGRNSGDWGPRLLGGRRPEGFGGSTGTGTRACLHIPGVGGVGLFFKARGGRRMWPTPPPGGGGKSQPPPVTVTLPSTAVSNGGTQPPSPPRENIVRYF